MFTQLLSDTLRFSIAGATGIGGVLLAAGDIASNDQVLGVNVSSLREIGSFGLIALFVIAILMGIRQLAPAFLKFLSDTKDEFIKELKEERAMREKSTDDFRQMLSSHKHDLREKLDEVKASINTGNDLTGQLIAQLKKSPCLLAGEKRLFPEEKSA